MKITRPVCIFLAFETEIRQEKKISLLPSAYLQTFHEGPDRRHKTRRDESPSRPTAITKKMAMNISKSNNWSSGRFKTIKFLLVLGESGDQITFRTHDRQVHQERALLDQHFFCRRERSFSYSAFTTLKAAQKTSHSGEEGRRKSRKKCVRYLGRSTDGRTDGHNQNVS